MAERVTKEELVRRLAKKGNVPIQLTVLILGLPEVVWVIYVVE